MRIAIIEDTEAEALRLLRCITDYAADKHQTEMFYSAESFITAFRAGGRYDAAFMDIEMDGMTGFEAAKILAAEFQDERPLVIFTTIAGSYAPHGYSLAWEFITKPYCPERIYKVLEAAQAKSRSKWLLVTTANRIWRCRFTDILYIEAVAGKTIIRTTEETCESQQTLEKMAEGLPGDWFYHAHRSYYINFAHVIEANRDVIVMANGTKISLSRKKKQEFFERWENYLRSNSYA